MEYDSFCRRLLQELKMRLGEEYRFRTEVVLGYNSVQKESLLIQKAQENFAPRLYLQECYENYRKGMTVESLADEIVRAVRETKAPPMEQLLRLTSGKEGRERMVVRLIKRAGNEQLLQEAVYLPFLDMAIVFYLLVEQNEQGVQSIRLERDTWERVAGGAPEEWLKEAIHTTECFFPASFQPIEAMLGGRQAGLSSGLFVLTNQCGINGATAILYDGMTKRIADYVKGDYYVIPSSIHEMLILPERYTNQAGQLKSILHEMNHTKVGKEEVLSDRIYQYKENSLRML